MFFIFEMANLGGLRFPKIGSMSLYENPWDGLLPLNEMIKWIGLK